jgi:hypothetical protein
MTDKKSPASSTDAERYIVIDGRRWRRSNPCIPETLRQELVNELMRARRQLVAPTSKAVKQQAREAVHDAKVALGERGEPWWTDPTDEGDTERITAALRTLLRIRTNSYVQPTEIAQIVNSTNWQSLTAAVHRTALEMQDQELLRIELGKLTPEDDSDTSTCYLATAKLLRLD